MRRWWRHCTPIVHAQNAHESNGAASTSKGNGSSTLATLAIRFEGFMFFSYTLCSAGLCGTVLFRLLYGLFSICTDSCILSLAPQYIPMIWLLCFYCLTTQYKLNIRLCIMQCLKSIAWQYILANSKWVYNSLKAWQKAQELCRLQFFLVPHMIIYYPPPDWMSWGDCGVYKGLHSYILFVQFCWWQNDYLLFRSASRD